MKSIIDCFDRAHIINLIDRTDRRQDVVKEFQRIGIEVPNPKVHFYTAIRPVDTGNFRHPGQRGCFQSHKQILELALRDGLKNVLVFEDDVGFRKVDSRQLRSALVSLSSDKWDIIYFGYLEPQDSALSGPLLPWQGPTLGGHFYAVNGPFIPTMLDFMRACEARPAGHPEGGSMCRDGTYNHFRLVKRDIRVLIAVPNLAIQRSSRTDLHPLNPYDRIICLQPMIRAVRRVKTAIRRSYAIP